jgi:poly(A) polymerase
VDIRQWREAKVRRFLTAPEAPDHLALHRIDCLACHGQLDTWQWCSERREQFLREPPKVPRLVSGHDLIAAGWQAGPELGKVLAAIDDERLEGRLTTPEEAIAWARKCYPPEPAR